MTTATETNTDLVVFDSNNTQMIEISGRIKNLVITDKDSRDLAFNLCRDANQMTKLVDTKRLELLRPITAEKKRLKAEYESEIKPLDEKAAQIEAYAKDKLISPLLDTIAAQKKNILAFDDREEKEKAARQKAIDDARKAEEAAARQRQAEADKKAKEEREAAEKAAEDARLEAERIANAANEEARKAQEEAANKKGIAGERARLEAEKLANEAKETARKAEEAAALESERLVREAKERADQEAERLRLENEEKNKQLAQQEADLNAKAKGREKITYEAILMDINLVQDIYLIKKVDMSKVISAIDLGAREIPGFIIKENRELKFK